MQDQNDFKVKDQNIIENDDELIDQEFKKLKKKGKRRKGRKGGD